MRLANGNFRSFLLISVSIIFAVTVIDASKDNKKHDKKHKDDNKHHKNSTVSHNHNHTSAHVPSTDQTAHNNPPPAVGWSLHNNPNQPPAGNPHGYAVQHHDPNQGAQPHHVPQQTVAQQPQNSGPSALGSGIGGLAIGAIGGAAGGYLLSNALNSDKSEEKKDEETTVISETATLADTSILPEVFPVNITEEASTAANAASENIESTSHTPESTKVVEETVNIQKASDILNPNQSSVEPKTETQSNTTTDNNFGVVSRISFHVLALSIIATLSLAF